MNRRWSILLLFLGAYSTKAQYTDQINSNRPGASIGAFSVGKNVIQAEAGLAFRNFTHAGYNNSTFRGSVSFLSLRWGFLVETLEMTYEGQYLSGSLNSKTLAISPISPFRPRRWKGKIVSDTSNIIIDNLNVKKRPISAVADNYEVRNAKFISIKTNKKIKFNLLYDSNRSLQKKIKIEQIRKETN